MHSLPKVCILYKGYRPSLYVCSKRNIVARASSRKSPKGGGGGGGAKIGFYVTCCIIMSLYCWSFKGGEIGQGGAKFF